MSSRYRNDYDRASKSGTVPRQTITRRGPYGMSLGRKSRSSAHWEPKSPPRNAAADDEKKGEFHQEDVEADLSQYKKGVFYFDETLKPNGNSSALSNGNGYAKSSPSKAEHQQFQLTLSDKPLPSRSNQKVSSRMGSSQPTDDSKDNSPVGAKEEAKRSIPIEKKKRRKAVVVTQQPRRDRRSHQMPMPMPMSLAGRVQPIVTISPNRTARSMPGQRGQRGQRGHGPSPYGAFVPPPSNYYYTQSAAYPYGAPNAAPSYYDLYPPNAAGYLSRPPSANPNANHPNNQLSHPNAEYSSYAPNGNAMNNGRAPGTMGEDGLWYPFAETQKDAYSTPKKGMKKGGKGGKKSDKEMSPGRRVNQIQKQLEYYFSPANLDADEFLQSAMDADGWVRIDVLIPFARMKVLGATKELVIEAAFHSTVIEIDHVAQDKVRMTAQWKAYCENKEREEREKKAAKAKKRSKSKGSKEREREKLIQSELDNAEVTESTIDAIVALVEKKQERRAKRRELREREKAKRKVKEEKENENEVGNDGEETKTTKSEATEELIEQDQAEAEAKNADGDADSKGDPDNNDMVEID